MFYVTYYNKNYTHGLHKIEDISNLEKFILSGGNELNKTKLNYIPEFITYESESPKIIKNYLRYIDLNYQIKALRILLDNFNNISNFKETQDKSQFYSTFQVPKKNNRGYRQITAPKENLKDIQDVISLYLVNNFKMHPHDAAHGFVKNRDAVTNAKMHQYSKHFVNIDLKDFFPSINTTILRNKLSKLLPFAILNHYSHLIPTEQKVLLQSLLDDIIDIATLNGSLPQGSPLSPLLSNLIMVDFDFQIRGILKNFQKEFSDTYVMYTRYADDIQFSSFNPLHKDKLIKMVEDILAIDYNDTLKINYDKIKYLKNTNRCYVTGVKINEKNDATLGYEKKNKLKQDIFNLFMEELNGTLSKEQTQETLGNLAWLHRIQPEVARWIELKYLRKFNSQYTKLSEHFKRFL